MYGDNSIEYLRKPLDKGALITEEPESYIIRKQQNYKKAMYITFGTILSLLLFIAFIIPPQLYFMLFLLFLVVASPLMQDFLIIKNKKFEPIKFYENGFEFQNMYGIKAFFYYTGLESSIVSLKGKKYLHIYRGQGFKRTLILSTLIWPELNAALPEILEKIGRGSVESNVRVEIENYEEYSKLYSRLYISKFLIMSLTIFLFFYYTVLPSFGGLVFIILSLGISFVFMLVAMRFISEPTNIFGKAPKIERKYVLIPLLMVILLLIPGYTIPVKLWVEGVGIQDVEYTEIINESVVNRVIELNKSICFSGNITIKNAILNISVENVGIVIKNGSNIRMENVSITGKHWKFESYGNLTAINSHFENMWGDKKQTNLQGGMEIYADAKFINCTFSNATTNAIMIYKSKVNVENCFFNLTGDEGIEVNSAILNVKNTKFVYCEWAVTTFTSKVYIENSSFDNCNHSISLTQGSSGKIRNVKITNSKIGIELEEGSTVDMKNVYYKNCKVNFIDNSKFYNKILIILILPLIIPMLIYGTYVVKKGKWGAIGYALILLIPLTWATEIILFILIFLL